MGIPYITKILFKILCNKYQIIKKDSWVSRDMSLKMNYVIIYRMVIISLTIIYKISNILIKSNLPDKVINNRLYKNNQVLCNPHKVLYNNKIA